MLKKNVKLIFAVVLISLIGFSSQTFAQDYYPYDNRSENVDMQWWNNGVPSRYALSANQIAKVNDIRARSSKKILPLQNKLYSLRSSIQRNNGYDVRESRLYRNKIISLENKISDINRATRVKIQKVLGTNQLTYFNNGGYGWWNMADDCWYSQNTTSYRAYGRNRMWGYYDGCCRW